MIFERELVVLFFLGSSFWRFFVVLKCLSYMLIKIPNTVFYNSFILLTLYKTSNQKLKIYNTLTLKFYGSRDADYIHRWKSAKSQERKQTSFSGLRKSAEALAVSFTDDTTKRK